MYLFISGGTIATIVGLYILIRLVGHFSEMPGNTKADREIAEASRSKVCPRCNKTGFKKFDRHGSTECENCALLDYDG